MVVRCVVAADSTFVPATSDAELVFTVAVMAAGLGWNVDADGEARRLRKRETRDVKWFHPLPPDDSQNHLATDRRPCCNVT